MKRLLRSLSNYSVNHYDTIVVGNGIAGCVTSLELSNNNTKVALIGDDINKTCSYWAQGGIIYKSKEDDKNLLISDILNAGKNANDIKAVKQLVQYGSEVVDKICLEKCEVDFQRNEDGELDLTQEASHSERRIIYKGDHTGKNIMTAIWKQIRHSDNIAFYTGKVYNILKNKNNECVGVSIFDGYCTRHFIANNVVLATGGLGGIYNYSTNPQSVAGEGFALAKLAGATLEHMDRIQFHPTSLYTKDNKIFDKAPLLTEALRGEGAILLNDKGERYMDKFRLKELEPRDIVATETFKQISEQSKTSGLKHVWLDISHKDANWLIRRFPTVYSNCMLLGIDITKDKIPTVPCHHYIMGGIKVDLDGSTNVKNLYAIGEVSSTGLHGMNRLASTSLLEGLVWGVKCASNTLNKNVVYDTLPVNVTNIFPEYEEYDVIVNKIKSLMWDNAGITRNKSDLIKTKHELEKILYTTSFTNTFLKLRCVTALEVVEACLQNML